jgi:CRISPR system Cascade subunit CasE
MNDLHIVRMVLGARPILRLLPRRWRDHDVDPGAMLHAGLANLFATSDAHATVPMQPFTIDDKLTEERRDPEHVFLLAYSSLAERELGERMGPLRAELLASFATLAVPEIAAGTRVSFRTRVCPTVRTKEPGPEGTERLAKSRELDAWLAERLPHWRTEPPSQWTEPFDVHADRERVYTAWLDRELSSPRPDAGIPRAPAELIGAQLVELRREPFRRTPPTTVRPSRRPPERPNAVLEGTLRVVDAEAFRALLARGVGRHRAFGFGMLLVRPAP